MLPSFKNEALLTTALSHRSSLNESSSGTTSSESYERLEFLGDAVLELATTEFLFEEHPTEPEGVLTSYRSALVKTTTLANVSRELKLGEKMYMSKGEEATGGRENDGLLADVCVSRDHEVSFFTSSFAHHKKKNRVDISYSLYIKSLDNEKVDTIKEIHSVRHFSLQEIDIMCKTHGFKRLVTEEFKTGKKVNKNVWGPCVLLKKIK